MQGLVAPRPQFVAERIGIVCERLEALSTFGGSNETDRRDRTLATETNHAFLLPRAHPAPSVPTAREASQKTYHRMFVGKPGAIFQAWPWRTSITNASHFTCRTIGQFGGRRPSPCPNLPHLTVVPEAVRRARPGQAQKSKLTPNFARKHRPHHAYLRFPLGSDDPHFPFFSRERDAFAVFLRTLPGCNRCIEIFWRRANRSKTFRRTMF